MMVSSAAEADGGDAGVSSEPNLIAFVGRRLSVREVKSKPKRNVIQFDAEYRVRAEVLQLVFGKYTAKEMEFSSFVHVGQPAFRTDEFGLVYVSRYKGRLVQQKYLFQPVYRTSDGRWAACGDPYARIAYVHRHDVKAEPIAFSPPVTFDTRKRAEGRAFPSFQAPFFRIENDTATCLMGNYPTELFRVMAEGYLKARGVLGSVAE
jgi:hypothetical protein